MNEDYVRKDAYEADKENTIGLIGDIRDRLEDYKASSSRQLTFWGIMIAVIAFLFAGMQIGIAVVLWLLTRTP